MAVIITSITIKVNNGSIIEIVFVANLSFENGQNN